MVAGTTATDSSSVLVHQDGRSPGASTEAAPTLDGHGLGIGLVANTLDAQDSIGHGDRPIDFAFIPATGAPSAESDPDNSLNFTSATSTSQHASDLSFEQAELYTATAPDSDLGNEVFAAYRGVVTAESRWQLPDTPHHTTVSGDGIANTSPVQVSQSAILAAPDSNSSEPMLAALAAGTMAATPSATLQTAAASSGVVINVTYDSSVGGAPAGFKDVVNSVVQFFENAFNDPITININVGWGEVHGQTFDSNTLAASDPWVDQYTYSQIRGALVSDISSSSDETAIGTLPISDPTRSDNWFLTSAEAKALGLPTSAGSIDGYVGFNGMVPYDYDNSDGVTSGSFDLYGVVAHEISEVMGRTLGAGSGINGYFPLDLFHYTNTAHGTRNFSGTTPSYFSIDGTTVVHYFNAQSDGDFGDWDFGVPSDSFDAFAHSGQILPISPGDLVALDAIGYNLANPPIADLHINSFYTDVPAAQSVWFGIDLENIGSAQSAATQIGIYLSSDSTITTADTLLDVVPLASLAGGGSAQLSDLPEFPTNLTPGIYYVGAIANYDQHALESNYADDTSPIPSLFLGNDSANTIDGSALPTIVALGGDDVININRADAYIPPTNGGDGFDTVNLTGVHNQAGNVFSAINVEKLVLSDANYQYYCFDQTLQAGQTLTVDASSLGPTHSLQWLGFYELDGTFNLIGGAGQDDLRGGGGNDVIDGGANADTMIGGPGNDIYVVDNYGDVVTELSGGGVDTVQSSITYTLPLYLENLTLTGSDPINGTGNADGNTIIGNSADNTIIAGNGNDTIDGGAGADIMYGGKNNDTFFVDNPGDVIHENNGQGVDTVDSSIDYTLHAFLENLTLIGTDPISGTGNADGNTLIGNSASNFLAADIGNDTIDGGGGADIMYGGKGNDLYIVDNPGDEVHESSGQGIDTVQSSISYTLLFQVENLMLSGSTNIDGTGNNLNNTLYGNTGDNTLDGGTGADFMFGGKGNDTFVVDNSGDVVKENPGQGNDTVLASISYTLSAQVENLTLTGSDPIHGSGNNLNNTIAGNAGANALTGGAGNDMFVFNTALGPGNIDNITDFAAGADKIGLDHAIFNQAGAFGALSIDAFFAGSAAHDASDRIIYDPATGALYYDDDGNGTHAAIQFAMLAAHLSLTNLDFIVS